MNARATGLIATTVIAFSILAGCGSDSDDSSKNNSATPPPLKTGGEFVFCTDVPYPPAEFLEGDKFVGYEIEIAEALAKELDTTAEFEKTLFDAIIPALKSKKCDAIISSMNVTEEREKEVTFVKYMEIGQSLMVAPDKADSVATLNDLSGMTVAVQVGTTLKDSVEAVSKELTADGKDAIEVKTFPDGGSAAAALKAGKVDVFFADSPVVADYVNKDSESFAFGGEPIDPLPVGIAMRPEDKKLHEGVQDAIDELYESGAMEDILKKWKVNDFALADA